MTWNDGDGRKNTSFNIETFYIPVSKLISLDEVDLSSELKEQLLKIAEQLVNDDIMESQAFENCGLEFKSVRLEKQIGKNEAKIFKKALPVLTNTLVVQKINTVLQECLDTDWELEVWEIQDIIEKKVRKCGRKCDSAHIALLSLAIIEKAYKANWEESSIYNLANILRRLGADFEIQMSPFIVKNSRHDLHKQKKND